MGVLLVVWMVCIDLCYCVNLLLYVVYWLCMVMGGVMVCIVLLVMGSCVEIFLLYFL